LRRSARPSIGAIVFWRATRIILEQFCGMNSYQTVEKTFRILELLATNAPLGVTEISIELGIEKSSVSRLLKTLFGLGYVVQSGHRGRYQLGPRLLYLGDCYLRENRLLKEAEPILQELAFATRSSAHLAVRVGEQLMVLAKEPSPERIQVASSIGSPVSPHASALGKVLLAGMDEKERQRFLPEELIPFTEHTIVDRRRLLEALDEVRRNGYALETSEEVMGVGCIAAPVRDSADRWIAALSVSGPLHGTAFRQDARSIELVVQKALALSALMGYQPDPQTRARMELLNR